MFCRKLYIYINHSKGVGTLCSLFSVSLPSVKNLMEGTCDIPYKNLYFIVTTEPNEMRFAVNADN